MLPLYSHHRRVLPTLLLVLLPLLLLASAARAGRPDARPVGFLTPTPSSNNDKKSRPHLLPTLKSRIIDQEEGPSPLSPPTTPSSSTGSLNRIRTLVAPPAAAGSKDKLKVSTTTSSSVCKGKVPDAAFSINKAIVECIKTVLTRCMATGTMRGFTPWKPWLACLIFLIPPCCTCMKA